MHVQITLTPAESKRLIAKAVVKLGEVKKAFKNGIILIGVGTTNAYVAEELLGRTIERDRFVAGVVLPKGTFVLPAERRLKEIIIRKGKIIDENMDDVLPEMSSNDVFLKGANALDFSGTAGVLMAGKGGGTIGRSLGTIMSKGVNLIIPVGVEKFIPGSIKDVAPLAGMDKVIFSTGTPVGMMPVHGKIITELEAIEILSGAEATVMAKGGVSGAEGAVTLVVRGTPKQLRQVKLLTKAVKGENPLEIKTQFF
jgi:hypothetical protein